MHIRPAQPTDAAAIAEVHVRSWQDAYRGLLPQDYLDKLDVGRRRAGWDRILAATAWPGTGAFVAECSNGIIGFAHIGPARDEDEPDAVGEMTAIYVLARAWGAGAGRALMAAAVATLADAGFAEASLWVLDGNTRARGFYELAGWAVDGVDRVEERYGFPLREVRYRRTLG
jgi:GNAT superfamily N-acetyltransferase